MPQLKLIITEDGSHSLYREDLKETYHSFHGAKGESMHVFIDQGLDYLREAGIKNVRVFEVGLGTGLNALLAANYASHHQVSVDYHSVEPIPVPKEIYNQLNYASNPEEAALLQKIHESDWEESIKIHEWFSLAKYEKRLEDIKLHDFENSFDVIFFDAFAPGKQAELWRLENLELCFALLNPGGILTTYCAQGQFKRNLATAGFEVQTLKGALGKKEMVRGMKSVGIRQ